MALLNDCKYGISIDGSRLALTLHKSGAHPTPDGDCGVHEFTYAFLPHTGGFDAQQVVQPAFELNTAPLATMGGAEPGSLASVDVPNVLIDTVKRAEDGNGYIFRLYECEQSRTTARLSFGFPVSRLIAVDMMEDGEMEIPMKDGTAELEFRGFEIKTLRVLP